MNIVIVQRLTLAHGIRGGMETQAQSLAEGLQERGHQVLVLTTPHPDGRATGHENGIAVRYLSPGSWRRYEPRWWRACEQTIRELHTRQQCDLVLSQSAGALDFLPRLANELHLPTVVVIHGTLQGSIRTTLASAASPRGLYRLLRLALTLPRHTLLWRTAARTVDRWVLPVQTIAAEWQRELSIPGGRIALVPYGIDTARFHTTPTHRQQARAIYGLPDDALAIVGVGRLEHGKGYQDLIQAMHMVRHQVPDAQLLLAGSGPYASVLHRLAQPLGERVQLIGHLPNGDLPALLAAADLFVMPTRSFETFPMSLAEAAAAGLPIIASAIGGIPDMLQQGKLGRLVPVARPAVLSAAIIELLQHAEVRANLAHAAQQHAHAFWSRTAMLDRIEQVLAEAVARHGNAYAP